MAEVIFWLVALAGGIGFLIYAKLQPGDLYYEGRIDKIGGKGGRQAFPSSCTIIK